MPSQYINQGPLRPEEMMDRQEIFEMYEDTIKAAYDEWRKTYDGITSVAHPDPSEIRRRAFIAGYMAAVKA